MLARGINPANTDATIAVKTVIRTGVPRLTRARGCRAAGLARHGEEDPALTVEESEDDRRQRDHRRAPSTRAAHGWPISRRISASGSALLAKPV